MSRGKTALAGRYYTCAARLLCARAKLPRTYLVTTLAALIFIAQHGLSIQSGRSSLAELRVLMTGICESSKSSHR